MTASAGAWYRVGTVNVTSGQQAIVGVGTNWQNDVIAIAIGDIFTVDSKTWYEVTAVNSDTSITLDRNFEGTTAAATNYAIVRNTSGTILTRIAGQVSVQFNQKQLFLDELRTWLNSNNASEELTDSHGIKQELKTPSQMVRDHDDKLAQLDEIHPFPWAMRNVEFEARRAANNEKFAASGFVHKGKTNTGGAIKKINEGAQVTEGVPTSLSGYIGLGAPASAASNDISKTRHPVINIAGVITDLLSLSAPDDSYPVIVKLPPVEDGTRTYDSATGVSVTHASSAIAFASETATNKVVTERVDMWGFEFFLREINDTDPFVYKHGLIQSQASNINGVATVSDNIRPIAYFSWYEGDDASHGKGVNWQTATEAQRIAIAIDPSNNIYFDDATGRFYQWSGRGRSFAGPGNGDWGTINSNTSSSANYLFFDVKSRPEVQGAADSAGMLGNVGPLTYGNLNATGINNNSSNTISLYVARAAGERAINGECYFYVGGTVSRLNKGAYHPGINPLGSAACANDSGGAIGGAKWNTTNLKITSLDQCFIFKYYNSTDVGVGAYSGTGSIESTSSLAAVRPDGRFYDAIYEGGYGGVCRDMRYSAWGLNAEDFADADLKIKSGEYRGLEKSVSNRVIDNNYWLTSSHANKSSKWINYSGELVVYISHTAENIKNGDSIVVIDKTKGLIFRLRNITVDSSTVRTTISNVIAVEGVFPTGNGNTSTEIYLVVESYSQSSLAGSFTHTDVIGDPANILLCDDLKDGWAGRWLPDLPDGAKDEFELTRPYSGAGTDITRTHTLDNGATWVQAATAIGDAYKNTVNFVDMPANQVTIVQYKTLANVTRRAVNTSPYGFGVGPILASSRARTNTARLLGYSLISKVLKSQNASAFGKDHEILSLTKTQFGDGFVSLISAGKFISEHLPLGIYPPTPESPAFKALNYNVVENQQGFINYAYTELKHNGTDWGDDSKIHIVDNQTTMLDENGNTVLVGTARCVEPLGWIKNDK